MLRRELDGQKQKKALYSSVAASAMIRASGHRITSEVAGKEEIVGEKSRGATLLAAA